MCELCAKLCSKHRIFKELCDEMSSEFEVLLCHSNVRLLSREKVLNRVFAMRVELSLFWRKHQHCHADYFEDSEFILILAESGKMIWEWNLPRKPRISEIVSERQQIKSHRFAVNIHYVFAWNSCFVDFVRWTQWFCVQMMHGTVCALIQYILLYLCFEFKEKETHFFLLWAIRNFEQ